jgi:gliding motility-associatede transport system auxiliary component
MGGGSLGVFGGRMKIELEGMEPHATPADTGLNRLLRPWGVVMDEGIVHDAQCGRAPLRTQIGMIPVPHPPVPIISFEESQTEHPVTFRLSSVPMPFTAALELNDALDGVEGVTVTTLMSSSEDSWLVTGPTVSLRPRPPRDWPQEGAPGPFPITVAIEGPLPSAFAHAENMSAEEESSDVEAPAHAEGDVHVLVSGGAFFMRDEALPEQQPNQECQLSSHLAFALNAIDWLANDSDLIAIRAKNVEDPQIEVPQDVRQAEEEARDAATDADEARNKALTAAAQGDETTANEAVDEHEEARTRREEALEKREQALAKWESTKDWYRWLNMLGIPFAFALFGLIRWQMRVNRKKTLKL